MDGDAEAAAAGPGDTDDGQDPLNLEAEQNLLGAILFDNEMYGAAIEFLRPEHFSEPLHNRIFVAIGETIAAGHQATPVTLVDRFRTFPGIDALGGARGYMAQLVTGIPSLLSVPSYAQTILDAYSRRKFLDLGRKLAHLARHPADETINELIGRSHDTIEEVARSHTKQNLLDAGEASADALVSIQAAHEGTLPGVVAGLRPLDRIIGSLKPGDLIVMAARPGMGKTTVASAIAFNVAREWDGVLFLSLEMSTSQIFARLLSTQAWRMGRYIPYQSAINGWLGGDDLETLDVARHSLKEIPLLIDDAVGRTVDQLGASIRSAHGRMRGRQTKLKLVIIDQLAHITPSKLYRGKKVDEIGEITAGLKALAKRLDVPIMLLHQLNRAVEHREDKRPQLSDLRDSGTIEQDADLVTFLFRPEYYIDRSEPDLKTEGADVYAAWEAKRLAARNQLDIIVAKNRQGGTGLARVWCDVKINATREREDV